MPMRRHAASLAIGAALSVVVLASTAPVEATVRSVAPSASVDWRSTDVRVSDPATQFRGAQKTFYEPVVAIDPTDPRTMLAFAIDLSVQNVRPYVYSVTRAFRSTDGGRTWSDHGPMRYTAGRDDITDSGDPVIAFERDGTAYYASLARPRGRRSGIYVHRSESGGATWRDPVLAVADTRNAERDVCRSADKEWLSIHPRTGTLYLTYTRFTFRCSSAGIPGDEAVRLIDIGVYLTTSRDQGSTWRQPRKIWDGYALGSMPRIGPDGTLYITFWGTTTTPPTACPTPLGVITAKGGGRPFAAVVAGSSRDGGRTWDYHVQPVCDFLVGELIKPARFVGGSFLPALAIDRSTGTAYVAYPDFIPAERRFTVEVIRSTNHGESWSAPREVTPGPYDARQPALVAARGVVRLMYYRTRGTRDHDPETPDGAARTFYVESRTGGRTWSPPVPLARAVGHPTEDSELGDYMAIDVLRGRVATIWSDARNLKHDTQIWARTGLLRRGVAPDAAAP